MLGERAFYVAFPALSGPPAVLLRGAGSCRVARVSRSEDSEASE